VQSLPLGFAKAVSYYSGGGMTMAVAITDFNGDGKLDIVTANQTGNNVGVLLGNGDGTFRPTVTYSSGGSGPTSVAVADLNGDSYPDLVVTNRCAITGDCIGGNVSVLLGIGDGTFRAPISYDTDGWDYTSQVAVADLNGDRHPDLIVSNNFTTWPSGSVSVLLGNGDGTFGPAVSYDSGGTIASSVAAADLNGDAKPDLVVLNSDSVTVLLGDGDGTFQSPVRYSSGFAYSGSVVIGDVNGDRAPDIVISNGSAAVFQGLRGAVSVLLGLGDGTFQPPITYGSGGLEATSVAIADVNGDGRPDIIVTNFCSLVCPGSTGWIHVLLGNGDGTFRAPVGYGTAGFGASSLAVADLNGDGRPDLAVVNLHMGNWDTLTLDVLLNTFTVSTKTAITSSPNPSFINKPVTFGATLASTWPIPDGQLVVFHSGPTLIGTGSTKDGVALLTTSSLSRGPHNINARYGGGGFLRASSGNMIQGVNLYPTSTTLVSSPNPLTYGQNVVFAAMVTTTGPLPPTGTVAFKSSGPWGAFTIGIVSLSTSGTATLSKSNLNAGSYPLTAVYKGDATNAASTSALLNQTVLQTKTAATIMSSVNPSVVGQAVTFTAKITSPTVLPTGPVTFTLGQTTLGIAQLSGGKATFTTLSLPPGSNVVKVTYLGNSNIAMCSAAVTQVVQP
jgi:hypothetical protein